MSSSNMPGTNPAREYSAGTQSPGLSARDRSRRRKWIYGVSMIVLIVVLFVLSRPATLGTKEVRGQPGGMLAQYRDKHRLSQAELGQIDPTSEMIRLATLGMRSFGETILWIHANEYQKKKEWTLLRATLDQISKFQPHSVLVWRYQAWNLSYNVSVAFDDYHDKFYWVIEGLNYMLDGVRLNDKEPRLYWDMAWFISNKIGRDDAAKYYRRLFSGERGFDGKDAPEFVKDFRERFTPPSGFPPGTNLRDSWHVGKAWFLAAESKIDPDSGHPVRGMATVIFYSDAPTCQFYYADNLEKDGIFGQVAQRAWKNAEDEWHAYGDRSIDTSYDELLQLNRKEELFDQAEEQKDQLDVLAPGARADLEKEKRATLSPENRTAWDTYREALDKYKKEKRKRKSEKNEKPLLQPALDLGVKELAEATPDEVARRSKVHREEALKLAKEIERKENLAKEITRERAKVNFDFWRTRAGAEQTAECLAAREAINNGDRAFAKGDMIRARPEYEKGMRGWRKVLDEPEFHSLVDDVSLGGDLADVIRRYDKCLEQDDLDRQDLPQPFVLQEVVDKHGYRQGSSFTPLTNPKKADASPSTGENPEKKGDTPHSTAESADKKDKPASTSSSKRQPKQPN